MVKGRFRDWVNRGFRGLANYSEDALTRCPVFGSRGNHRILFRIFYPLQSRGVSDQPVSGSVNDDTTAAPACSEPGIEGPVVDTWFWVVLLRALRFPPLFLNRKRVQKETTLIQKRE